MKKIRLGVIGCGFIGKQHLDLARKLDFIELAAVVDLDPRRAKETATEFGVGTAHADASALLHDAGVDAVVLAMPTAGRAALAIEAMKAGKHVLVEKPAAMNADEIVQMMAARGKLVCASCSSRYRFSPVAKIAGEVVASGALGELRLVRSRAVDAAGPPPKTPPPAWRVSKAVNGGGILVNWGSYDLDFLLSVTGWSLVPEEALGQTWRVAAPLSANVAPGSDAESHAIALIRCRGGTVISLERGEFLAAASDNAVEIIGTRGSLRVTMNPTGKNWSVIHDDTTPESGVVSKTLWTASENELGLPGNPLGDFAAAIRDGRPPLTGLEQAMVITKITDAIFASAERGAAVSITNGTK